jgi:hypothetical protein
MPFSYCSLATTTYFLSVCPVNEDESPHALLSHRTSAQHARETHTVSRTRTAFIKQQHTVTYTTHQQRNTRSHTALANCQHANAHMSSSARPLLWEESSEVVVESFEEMEMDKLELEQASPPCRPSLARVLYYVLDLVVVSAWAFALGALFTLPYCGLLFRCGCTWVWAGGFNQCNIFDTSSGSPSCPFCSLAAPLAWIPQWGTAMLSVLTTLLVCWIPRRFPLLPLGWLVRVLLPVACFLVYTFLLALVVKLASPHYPYFLWIGVH